MVLFRMAEEVEGALAPGAPGAPERFIVVPPPDGRPPWSELRLAATARERTARSAGRIARARTLLLSIAGEVEGALAPGAPGAPERFIVVPPGEGRPPWSELRLATAASDDVRLVAYRVEAAAPGPGVLVRREGTRFAPPDTPEPAGAAALAGVRSFRVRCFDGGEWKAAWTTPALPRAVELALGVDDGAGGALELTTAVTLPLGGAS